MAAGFSGGAIALARYASTGHLDRTFGAGGKVKTRFPGRSAQAFSLVVLRGGGIIVAGTAAKPDGTGAGFALVRYRPDGTPDKRFGDHGEVFTPMGAGADVVIAQAITLWHGKVVAAGQLSDPFGGGGAFAVARYSARTGQLDKSFSHTGIVTTPVGQEGGAEAVVVLRDGRIVAAGQSVLPNQGAAARFALVRYLPDGRLDPSFGKSGLVTTSLPGGDAGATSLARQSDGRLVAAGWAFGTGRNANTSRFALVRYKPRGAVDSTFGRHGIVLTSFGKTQAQVNALRIGRDGRILVAGAPGFSLARYLAH